MIHIKFMILLYIGQICLLSVTNVRLTKLSNFLDIILFKIQMSQPQLLQLTQAHQKFIHELKTEINTALSKNHFSFHATSGTKAESQGHIDYVFKIKSNDGELYQIHVQSAGETHKLVEAKSLLTEIQSSAQHEQRIQTYVETLNTAYKTNNTSYNIVSIQKQIDDENNFVYRVKGKEDGKQYKIKIERPPVIYQKPEQIKQS